MSADPNAGRTTKWIDGVPDFLHAVGIKKGGWQFISQRALRTQTRPGPGHTLKSQLWAVGMLHGPKNQGELAIVWYKYNPKNLKEKWRSRAMTPGDMSRYLVNAAIEYYAPADIGDEELALLRARLREQYSKEHIRRGLAQMEVDGLCERRRKSDGKPLRSLMPDQCRRLPSGQVETYFWSNPKDADPEKVKAEWQSIRQTVFPPLTSATDGEVATDWLPKNCIPKIVRAFGIQISECIVKTDETQLSEKDAAAAMATAMTKPEYHERLHIAWESARESFVDKLRDVIAAEVAVTRLRDAAADGPPEVADKSRQGVSTGLSERSSPPASPPSSSSIPIPTKKKETNDHPKRDDDDPKREYASARDEVKAIYFAKTDSYPSVQLLDRIEGILSGKGETFDSFLEVLKPHLGNTWKNPGGFLTHMARDGFSPTASPPQEKPKPKCSRCRADNQRGAILVNGAIVPCPDCSTTPEWGAELAAKLKRPARTEGAGGND